jgi:aspartyl/asparaginyl-tRNA synthetase
LLAKYNALLKEHDESLVLSKQVSDQYDKLKFEHVDLRQKYNYLKLVYEASEDNLEQASKIESTTIVKVDASTSCDDLPNDRVELHSLLRCCGSPKEVLMILYIV